MFKRRNPVILASAALSLVLGLSACGPGQQIIGATEFPANMALSAIDSEALAYEIGKSDVAEGRALGIPLTYSPVVDIQTNPDNPVLGVRPFDANLDLFSRMAGAYIRGYQENGIWKVKLKGPGIDKVLDPKLDLWDAYLTWKENYPENEVFGTNVKKKMGIFDLKPGDFTFRFECVGAHPFSVDPKTGKKGYSLRLDGISVRRLPWGDMGEWYRDYLKKEEALFSRKVAQAKTTVAELAKAVKAFRDDLGRYPESQDLLIMRPARFLGVEVPISRARAIQSQLFRCLVRPRQQPRSFRLDLKLDAHQSQKVKGGQP